MKKHVSAAGLLLLMPTLASAWENHAALMPGVMRTLPSAVSQKLQTGIKAPCLTDDEAMYRRLIPKLELNVASKPDPTAATACRAGVAITGEQVLQGGWVDEPDHGMDENLPASADPRGDRRFMGGLEGPTSKGYRHMYFGGWKLAHPLSTFQVPTHTLGQSPDRVEALAQEARSLYRSGDKAWALRVGSWAAHYLQDLAQPFHSAQIPSLGMVPWFVLWTWPPSEGFNALVTETTRTISNYHWAYEAYILIRARQGEASPMADCFFKPEDQAVIDWNPATQSPKELALAVARRSVEIAPEVGAANLAFFGTHLKTREVDIPRGKGEPDYQDLTIRPDLMDARARLEKISCVAVANGILATRKILEWVTR